MRSTIQEKRLRQAHKGGKPAVHKASAFIAPLFARTNTGRILYDPGPSVSGHYGSGDENELMAAGSK